MEPALFTGIGTIMERPSYECTTGKKAWNTVLQDIRINAKVQNWFLSCLVRGRILLIEKSKADGFIPE